MERLESLGIYIKGNIKIVYERNLWFTFIFLIRCRIFCRPVRFPKMKIKLKGIQSHNFPIVLYGCETWFLTMSGERKLREFENRLRNSGLRGTR